MKAGFTGPRIGMTFMQKEKLAVLLSAQSYREFHHGDCVGADAEAHEMALKSGVPVVIHPPENPILRAHCLGASKTLPEKDYIDRNHAIVDACDVLIGTPSSKMMVMKSGTWATIRYARKRGKQVILIYPDGSME